MRRRDFFKGLGVAGILSVSPLSAIDFNSKRENLQENYFVNKNKNKRVVIVGGGISGLSVANNIRAIDKEVEIIILEKEVKKEVVLAKRNAWNAFINEIKLEVSTACQILDKVAVKSKNRAFIIKYKQHTVSIS